MTKLSKKNFEFFEEEGRRWLKFFGIYQWDCRFFFEKNDEALARVEWNTSEGIAVFYLAKSWGKDKVCKKTISQSAFHEVCELLLNELNDMARGSARDVHVEEAIHRVIRGLENTIFEYEWRRRQISEGISGEFGVEGADSTKMCPGCSL